MGRREEVGRGSYLGSHRRVIGSDRDEGGADGGALGCHVQPGGGNTDALGRYVNPLHEHSFITGRWKHHTLEPRELLRCAARAARRQKGFDIGRRCATCMQKHQASMPSGETAARSPGEHAATVRARLRSRLIPSSEYSAWA